MKKWFILLFIIGLLGAAATWRIYLLATEKPAESIDKIQEKSGMPVRVFEVIQKDIEKTITVSGSIKPFQDIYVSPKVTERIMAFHAATGQTVQQDQPLVTLDDTLSQLNLEQAQASLAQSQEFLRQLQNGSRPEEIEIARTRMEEAQARYELQNLEYQRQKQLYQEEATTLQNLQGSEAAFASAKANREGAAAQYELTKAGPREEEINMARIRVELAQVAVRQAEKNLADHHLQAPFAGEVCLRLLDPGDIAEMNKPIFELVDIHQVYLDLDVSELYVPKLSLGQAVRIAVDALPEKPYTGTIAEINPVADATDRSYVTRILIPNEDRTLRPGMFARAYIAAGRVPGALLVAKDAVKKDINQYYVLAVDENNVVQKKFITPGDNHEEFVEVIEGLSAGEKVITLSVNIEPGTRIIIEP